jgi:hypothetical protein
MAYSDSGLSAARFVCRARHRASLDATEFGPFLFISVNSGPTINNHAAMFLATLAAIENFALNGHIKGSYPRWSELMQPADQRPCASISK